MSTVNVSVANSIHNVHNIQNIEVKEEVVFELLSDESESDESCQLVICEDAMDDESSIDPLNDEIESLNALKETLDDDSLTANSPREILPDHALNFHNNERDPKETTVPKTSRLTKKKVNRLLNDLEEYLRNTETIPEKDAVHKRIEKIAVAQSWKRSVETARRERKRLQNRRAAALYRMRKKHEYSETAEMERVLIEKNQELRRRVEKLQTVVACIRTMFGAVSKAKVTHLSSPIEHLPCNHS